MSASKMEVAGDGDGPCKFCDRSSAKYTCPRCNYGYCSVDCYKHPRHANCSEDFYKEWVQTLLHEERANPEARRKMEETLLSAHEDKDEDVEPLAERLADLASLESESSIWNRLTEEERSEFHESLQSGEIGKYVPIWRPWWEEEVKLVVEMAEQPTEFVTARPLSELTTRPPSPRVVNGVLDVLCSYVYVARLYNGDLAEESVDELFATSAVLDEDAVFGTASEAVQSVCQRVVNHGGTSTETCRLLESFVALIRGTTAKTKAGRALSEVRKLLEDSSKHRGDRERKKKMRRAGAKCDYFLSWTAERGDVLSSLVPEVEAELASVAEEAESFAEAEKAVKERLKKEKRVLIEEI